MYKTPRKCIKRLFIKYALRSIFIHIMKMLQQKYVNEVCDCLLIEGKKPTGKAVAERLSLLSNKPVRNNKIVRDGLKMWVSGLYERVTLKQRGVDDAVLNEMYTIYKAYIKTHNKKESIDGSTKGDIAAHKKRYKETYNLAFKTCDQLLKRGKLPNTKNIFEIIDRGSMTTIQEAIFAWWSELPYRLFYVRDHQVIAPVEVIGAAKRISEYYNNLYRKQVDVSVQRLNQKHDFEYSKLLNKLEDCESANEELKIEIGSLRIDNTLFLTREKELMAKIEALENIICKLKNNNTL